MYTTEVFHQLWQESRTRFSYQLSKITEGGEPNIATILSKKLGYSPKNVGFLIRHIADVELLYSKNVFGQKDLIVYAQTLIEQSDTEEWTDWAELVDYQNYAYNYLKKGILAQTDYDWGIVITRREFGTKTKAEALGRVISHTAYHTGQIEKILNYG